MWVLIFKGCFECNVMFEVQFSITIWHIFEIRTNALLCAFHMSYTILFNFHSGVSHSRIELGKTSKCNDFAMYKHYKPTQIPHIGNTESLKTTK